MAELDDKVRNSKEIEYTEGSGSLVSEVENVDEKYLNTILQINRSLKGHRLESFANRAIGTNVHTAISANYEPGQVAGIGFTQIYTDGDASHNSAINTAALSFFNYVKGKVKTLGNFNAQDLVASIIKVHQPTLILKQIARILASYNAFSRTNAAYGTELTRALVLGFGQGQLWSGVTNSLYQAPLSWFINVNDTFIDVRKKMGVINSLVTAMALPAGMKFTQRQLHMCGNIYQDDPGKRSQLFFFYPKYLYTFDVRLKQQNMLPAVGVNGWCDVMAAYLAGIDAGYTAIAAKFSTFSWANWGNLGEYLLDVCTIIHGVLFYMVQDDDMNTLASAITTAYDLSPNFDFNAYYIEVPDVTDKLTSVYDHKLNEVLRNAMLADIKSNSLSIFDDTTNSVLVQGEAVNNPGIAVRCLSKGTMGVDLLPYPKDMPVSVFSEVVDPDTMVAIYEWMYTYEEGLTEVLGSLLGSARIRTCGTELLNSFEVTHTNLGAGSIGGASDINIVDSTDIDYTSVFSCRSTGNYNSIFNIGSINLRMYSVMPRVLLFEQTGSTTYGFIGCVFNDLDTVQYWPLSVIRQISYDILLDNYSIHYSY